MYVHIYLKESLHRGTCEMIPRGCKEQTPDRNRKMSNPISILKKKLQGKREENL